MKKNVNIETYFWNFQMIPHQILVLNLGSLALEKVENWSLNCLQILVVYKMRMEIDWLKVDCKIDMMM